uniref:BHLH domain-containing protein n=1 Tax=Noccaea caerulescens TaxID=107243 RepID=A0A1J3CWR7_NOCCA
MYQSSSSTSSSSQRSSLPGGSGGLIRYGSAPGSLINSVVDEVIGGSNARDFNYPPPENFLGHFFTGADSSSLRSDSTTCGVNSSDGQKNLGNNKDILLDRSYGGFNEISQNKSNDVGNSSGSYSLARQRSSPADFFSYLSGEKNSFSLNQPTSDYSPQGGSNAGRGQSRLKSQLSFTSHDPLSRISEVNETSVHDGSGHSFSAASFGAATESWDDGSGSIGFTVTRPTKRAKDIDSGLFSQYSLPSDTSMNYMDNYMQLPEDSVPCKIRAKRGCATHPRSIAERERRTRISGKLKKLQDLVPNMDKQTSYSDMLDLAVQHIKGLQHQLQNLKKEQENCTCGCSERPS